MRSQFVANYILLVIAAFCIVPSHLSGQTDAKTGGNNETNGSWTATTAPDNSGRDVNPTTTYRVHTESGGRTVDKTVTERRGFNGGYEPYLETERESVRVDSSTVRTIERVFNRDPEGRKTLVRMIEEEKRSSADGGQKVVRTVSDSTLNGGLQVVKREQQDTRQISPNVRETTTTVMSPDVNGGFSPSMKYLERQTQAGEREVRVKKSTLLPDGAGNWKVNEVTEGTIKNDGSKNQTKEENVWRRTAEGDLSVVERTVTRQSAESQGEARQTVETFSNSVPGGFSDHGLVLNQRVTTVQRPKAGGGKTTEQRVEQINPGDPRAGVRTTQKEIDIVVPGRDGAIQEQRTIQSLDANGNLSTVWVDTSQKTGEPIVVDTKQADQRPAAKVNTQTSKPR